MRLFPILALSSHGPLECQQKPGDLRGSQYSFSPIPPYPRTLSSTPLPALCYSHNIPGPEMLHRSQQTLTLSLQWGPWRAEVSPRLAPAPITHSQLPQPSRMDPHFQLTHRFGSIALPVCTSCGSTVCTPKHYSRKSEETGRLEDEEVGGCSRGKPHLQVSQLSQAPALLTFAHQALRLGPTSHKSWRPFLSP